MSYTFAPPEIASTSVRTYVRVRFEDENANMTSTVLKKVRRDESPRFIQVPQPAPAADWEGEDFKVLAAREPARLVALVAKGRLADHDLTYAAEVLGLLTETDIVAAVLVPLTRHASSVVREGVIYGLSRHVSFSPVVRAALERLVTDDPSPEVRAAAIAALDITPSNLVRVFGGKRHGDPIHNDLLDIIGEIRAKQEPEVPAEYRVLAEAACASQPKQQTAEEIHEWALQLGGAIVED